jgi:hypothetical protein
VVEQIIAEIRMTIYSYSKICVRLEKGYLTAGTEFCFLNFGEFLRALPGIFKMDHAYSVTVRQLKQGR